MLETDLTGHFLIAMPALQDNNFSQTVTYICEHNANGTLGITINRPSEFQLSEILTQLSIEFKTPAIGLRSIFVGGPVQQDRGFVLHAPNGHWESSLRVNDSISVTTSRDILQAISQGDKRILMINGEPVPYALARMPAPGETRGNLAAGGTGVGMPLTERERWICQQVGPTLKQMGLVFVGLDVIGDYLTEINVTSPTCIRELDTQFNLDIGMQLMDCIESLLS